MNNLIKSSIVSFSFSLMLFLNLAMEFVQHIKIFDSLFNGLPFIDLTLMSVVIFDYSYRKRNTDKRIFNAIIIMYIFYLCSIIFNGLKSGAFSFINIPLTYFFLFAVLPHYKIPKRTFHFFFIIILIWSILPVVIMIFEALLTGTFLESNFSGYAKHKNGYSCLAGIVIILTIMSSSISKYWQYFIISILAIGIFSSNSRSGIIAALLSGLYFLFFQNKSKFKTKVFFYVVTFIILFFITFQLIIMYGIRNDLREVMEVKARIELYEGFYETWKESPYWGQGEIYYYKSANYRYGLPAHNFVLQTATDFGIFVMITYVILLIITWFKFDIYFKTFLLYLVVIGLFQPYFFFGGISGLSLIVFFLAIGSKSAYGKEVTL